MSKRFTRLSRLEMRRTLPGQAITEHGITFQREPNGDGVFSVNIMVDRRRIHRVIGRESEGVTRQQAEDFISQARSDARHDRLDLPEARKTPLGFREAAVRYLERLGQEHGKNIKTKSGQIAQHLAPFLGNRPISQIEASDIERYKRDRRTERAAPATINRELAVLSHLLNCAREWGWLKTAPVRIRRFKEEGGRITYLTPDQCAALEKSASEDQNGDVHAFVLIGLRTGMRHTEILSIRREHVDLDHKAIWIPQAKAGAREQPITDDLTLYLATRLEMLPPGSPWLFPSPASRTGHAHTIRKAFRRSTKRAGLDPDVVTPHILRHTVVTHLVQAGVDLPTVQRVSGHKTLAMVARYAHQNGEHIQAAMAKLESRIRKTGT